MYMRWSFHAHTDAPRKFRARIAAGKICREMFLPAGEKGAYRRRPNLAGENNSRENTNFRGREKSMQHGETKFEGIYIN